MIALPSLACADGRSVWFLKGMASSIAAHCPALPLDKKLVAKTKHLAGNPMGTQRDFREGFAYIIDILKSGEGPSGEPTDCENICDIRVGTCFFNIEPSA